MPMHRGMSSCDIHKLRTECVQPLNNLKHKPTLFVSVVADCDVFSFNAVYSELLVSVPLAGLQLSSLLRSKKSELSFCFSRSRSRSRSSASISADALLGIQRSDSANGAHDVL